MEFLNNLREKAVIRRQEEAKAMADEFITFADFNDRVFIAFQGNPLVLLDEDLTMKEAMSKIKSVRNNYIDSKLKNLSL